MIVLGGSFDGVDNEVVYGDDLRQADEEAEYLAEMEMAAKERDKGKGKSKISTSM